jgi:hypothetical protein
VHPNKIAIIDEGDYDLVSRFNWHWVPSHGDGYALAYVGRMGGKSKFEYMHRMITGCQAGLVVDHKNGNGLDNRRDNIWACTQSQNRANSRRAA